MRRLIVCDVGEECADPFKYMFDQVLKSEPFSVSKEDVLLLEGGTDVNPSLYGDTRGRYTQFPDTGRDARERHQIKRFADAGAGILGICRGAQLATIFAGGTLIQHVTGHGIWTGHDIVTEDGEIMLSSSVHHQMMYPFQLPQDRFEILAKVPSSLSKCYLDGHDRNMSQFFPIDFVEPEIVWYPKIRALAIQGHPEYMHKQAPFVTYSQKLIERYFLASQ